MHWKKEEKLTGFIVKNSSLSQEISLQSRTELYERNMFLQLTFIFIILHNFPFHIIIVCVCEWVNDELNTTCLVTHFWPNVKIYCKCIFCTQKFWKFWKKIRVITFLSIRKLFIKIDLILNMIQSINCN